MPVSYHFKVDDCPSFGGASLSSPREDVLLQIYAYLMSNAGRIVSSRTIQQAIDHNDGDIRSVIAILKKFGFTNLVEGQNINTNDFFTDTGKTFIHVLRAKSSLTGNEGDRVKDRIVDAYHHILQEGIWKCYKSSDVHNTGIQIVLNTLGIIKTMSFNEYCFALSEMYSNASYSFSVISDQILSNRTNGVVYSFVKDVQRRTGLVVETNFDTILQSTREILYQAGITTNQNTPITISDIDFFKKHKLPYHE